MLNAGDIVSLPKSEWEDIMKRRVEIDCPHCAETIEHFPKSFNFKGNIKCPKCNKLFWILIENYDVLDVATKSKDNSS
jgi:peptide subunit release factor 1 (eRF1)